ncbi:ATP-binding protein [Sphingomonas sp. MMSM20]|uniref:sensor histidine kinase n=1 Tax=Sphingomonas lycopersici TaxID=2951807 RepID=UPI00223849A0|nr:ATP-binding protein [Sphingomonas lycopersici]MCW6528678.1 ATP-binding protein [Sphingomonas lycopersici]
MRRPTGWRRAVIIILGVQLLFWSIYALIVLGVRPIESPEADRGTAARAALPVGPGRMGAYVADLPGPAVLRLPGWQPVVLHPARASLLSPAQTGGREAASLSCLDGDCPEPAAIYAGPFDRMSRAAALESFQRFDMVWVAIAVAMVTGTALLVLLPVNRMSRLQTVTGLFQILVGADAWLTTFGAASLPYRWFPLLRFGTEYLMLTGAALAVNAFAGWRASEARMVVACFVAAFAALLAAMALGEGVATIVPWLDAAALTLLVGYGLLALLRMARTAPGPAIRVLALLLAGLASIAFDLFFRPPNLTLQASVLAPPLATFGILFEIALQGRLLNQEAEEARSDLERQVLEQDASLLRSSQLLRHQERLIAIDAERQRLLRDMHDGVGGVLTHLLLDLRGSRLTQGEIEQGLQSAVDDLRNMASAIDAGNEPIDEALAMFCERVEGRIARSGIAFDYRCTLPIPAPSLDVRRLLSLYRLLQEGIANSVRHARASRIALTIEAAEGKAIRITLADDGIGFDPGRAVGSPGEGRGLTNIRRRAEQMRGRIAIDSAPGEGARLILTIPVAERKS